MTKAILIGTERIDLKEIDLDIDPKKSNNADIWKSGYIHWAMA